MSLTPGIPSVILGGDDRSFAYADNTFRSFQAIVLDPTLTRPALMALREFGESTGFSHLSARWAGIGKPWWWWKLTNGAKPIDRVTLLIRDDNNKITVDKVAGQTTARFFLKAGTPLILAPPIDLDLRISVRRTAAGTLQYQIVGGHDGFPAYELYLNGSRVYSHDPVAEGKSPLDLFGGPDEIRVNTPWLNVPCRS